MKQRTLSILVWSLVGTSLFAGGFRLEGSSPGEIASSGAITARISGAMALFLNPANMGNLDSVKGEVVFGGSALFQRGYYSNLGRTTWSSKATAEATPYGAVSYSLTDSLTLAAGYAQTYKHLFEWDSPDFIARYSGTGQEMTVNETVIGISYELGPKWAIGISARQASADFLYTINRVQPIYGSETFPQFFYDYTHQFEGDDEATGLGFGAYFTPKFGMKFGITYFSGMDFEFDGAHTLSLAEGETDQRILNHFNSFDYANQMATQWSIPDRWTLAASFRTTVRTRVEFDLSHESWGDVDRLEITSFDENGEPISFDLGSNWRDTFDFSSSAEFRQTKNLVWRAGLGYRLHVLDREELSPGYPIYDRFSASGGISFKFGKNVLELSYAYNQYRDSKTYNQEYEIDLSQPDLLSSNQQQGLFESQRHHIALGYRRRF